MAAGDGRPVPKKNVAFRATFPILDNSGTLVSAAAGLDSEISKDGGAFTDCANEATEIGSSGIYTLDLSSTEMDADTVAVIVKTTTSNAKTTPLIFYPEESGDIRCEVTLLSSQAKADVNAEVLDVLNVDTFAEPGQGTPAATASIVAKLNYLYKSWRNKKDNNGSETKLYADDATTVDQKQTTSESGGTVTKGEWATGP